LWPDAGPPQAPDRPDCRPASRSRVGCVAGVTRRRGTPRERRVSRLVQVIEVLQPMVQWAGQSCQTLPPTPHARDGCKHVVTSQVEGVAADESGGRA
jgi:hypothetical protein